mmetsp:Transcript_32407/g.52934  ORF Transcript_32407/g.52934 Transcript_32407/m.52934 type:complete len:100 (-) Transcript_32407:63-362(-)
MSVSLGYALLCSENLRTCLCFCQRPESKEGPLAAVLQHHFEAFAKKNLRTVPAEVPVSGRSYKLLANAENEEISGADTAGLNVSWCIGLKNARIKTNGV